MNRIVNLGVIPAITALVFFLITCSNQNELPVDPPNKVETDSSSSIYVEPPTPSSSSQAQVSSSSNSSSSSRSSSSAGASSSSSARSSSSIEAVPPVPNPKDDFKETVKDATGKEVTFDMIYIPGGTFTIGCEKESGCPSDSKPVAGVTVSSYYIAKTEITTALWKAVMGNEGVPQYSSNTSSFTNMTWYDAMEFTCKLSQMTGRKYHMPTEAEWEYAAKKYKDKLEKIGSGEEWAYNSWSGTHMGGTDPVGPGSGQHTQKTRRDAQGTSDNITGRLIRSIEGMGPALRLALSDEMDYPPNYVSPCDLHAPKMEGEPVNSYRDMRWVTGDTAVWAPPTTGSQVAAGSFQVRVWEDGTAQLTSGYGGRATTGQWFTSNNIAFVFVPSSGSSGLSRYGYIFLDDKQGSLVSSDKGFMDGGFIGRIEKRSASSVAKPTVADLKSGEALAKAQENFETLYKMVDMEKLPKTAAEITSAYKQDERLLDGGATKGWFQNNTSAGGVHHYRKDVDLDEFRFTVNQGGNRVMLANGKWFTINNIFLRVIHEKGYTADYLYSVSGTGDKRNFYHDSFQGYERGDFRMFALETNDDAWPKTTCGDICSKEIPKGLDQSMYNGMANGKSTFTPAPCPAGGCK
ncbi:MAG: formylglycine-generating enzyme family protein [Fibromonadaceae bacterium]|nr:formylglycine-generating enzyme family protein [Fibromonadaceae bacterium]